MARPHKLVDTEITNTDQQYTQIGSRKVEFMVMRDQ